MVRVRRSTTQHGQVKVKEAFIGGDVNETKFKYWKGCTRVGKLLGEDGRMLIKETRIERIE